MALMNDQTTRDSLIAQLRGVAETVAEIVAAADAGHETYGNDADGYYWADYPLEIVDARGRSFAVVLSTGGPHIELTADGYENARLVGYWAGETATLYDDAENTLTRFLELFIDRDDDGPGR